MKFCQNFLMKANLMKVRHLGIVCENLEVMENFYTKFGFKKFLLLCQYQNIKFFLAKGYSSTNLVAGSEVYANVSNGEIITISGEKLVQLNAYESIGIFSDTSSSSVQVLASGSSFNIEMISQ